MILAAFSSPARGAIAIGQPGGFLSLPFGDFTDSTTGVVYGLTLIGRESADTAGLGQFTLQLLGPSISACSTHGGGIDIGNSPDGENFSGNFPLTEIQCGTSYSMAVSIEGCTAKTELHGYSHSDYPAIIYTGSNTVEATFQKTSAESGKVSGPVEMDTCP